MENSFFDDGNKGQKSANRLIFITGMIFCMALAFEIVTVYLYEFVMENIQPDWIGIGTFLTLLFGVFTTLKLVQKGQEIKKDSDLKADG